MDMNGKADVSMQEYLQGRIVSCFGMKKVSADKIKKTFENDDNK